MKYVADASVGFKWVVPEIHSDKAHRLRDDCELVTADSRLVNALQKQYPFVVELAALP